jgi:hypothetical protein
MANKLADATPERIADYFVSYLYDEYPGDMHVRRVASWVGLITLGIYKLADVYRISHKRQFRFDYIGRSFKAKFNHRTGSGKGFSRGGIDIVEILPGRGAPEGDVVCTFTSLQDAANFYDDPAKAFRHLK